MTRCENCFARIENENDTCSFCNHKKGQPAAELYHLFPGTLLKERYIIGQVVGFGGFGITYKAWDTKFDIVVAIKEYYPSGLVNRLPSNKDVVLFAGGRYKEYNAGLVRFLGEARNMAKFQKHPNIINIFEFFEENNTAYIVMEFLDGVTLNDFLKTNDLDYESCIEIAQKVCLALSEIHDQKIIHRDVSPDNIFLCMNGNVKLIDFGAARFSADEEKKMTIILKPGFAPPEQYESINKQGPWTDIYALGATLYLMLTKTKPEESTNRKIQDKLKSPVEINHDISEQVSNTIMKAMALDYHFRFANIKEFLEALIGNKKVVPLIKEKKKRKTRRLCSVLAVILVLVIITSVVINGILDKREASTLPSAIITFYYPKINESRTQAFKEIIDNFENSYENVTIKAVALDSSLYSSQLDVFLTSNNASVFVCDDNDIIAKQYAHGIDGVLDNIDDKCVFVSSNKDTLINKKQIPLSVSVPVLYINTSVNDGMYKNKLSYFISPSDISSYINGTTQLMVNDEFKEFASEVFKSHVSISNSANFIANNDTFYYGSNLDYIMISKELAGKYQLSGIDSAEQYGHFTDTVCINKNATKNQKKVAETFVAYLLSDYAQETLYVKYGDGSLPINKNILDIFSDVYSELSVVIPLEDYCKIN